MNLFTRGFDILLHKPLFSALILLYAYLPGHDFGIAVIVLTILIRILLYPLMVQSIKSQKILSELQPKLQKIQQQYKDNKEKQTKEILTLYQQEKINPFGSLVPLLVQFPVLVALYRVFWNWKGMPELLTTHLYGFISNPGTISPMFLGLINLSVPNLWLAILAGIAQFFQTKMFNPSAAAQSSAAKDQKSQITGMMQKQMLYFFPIFTVLILSGLPSAVGLYWLVSSLFSIFQQSLIFKKLNYAQPGQLK